MLKGRRDAEYKIDVGRKFCDQEERKFFLLKLAETFRYYMLGYMIFLVFENISEQHCHEFK